MLTERERESLTLILPILPIRPFSLFIIPFILFINTSPLATWLAVSDLRDTQEGRQLFHLLSHHCMAGIFSICVISFFFYFFFRPGGLFTLTFTALSHFDLLFESHFAQRYQCID